MAFLYTHKWKPSTPPEEFDAATLAPSRTPLAQALAANGLAFSTRDLTAADERLTRLRGEVLRQLEPRFRAEGLGFVYENRMGEVDGMIQAHERGLFRRYLYHVQTTPGV